MAALDPSKGHAALRRGRFSAAGATYFLTLCTEDKRPGLANDSVAAEIHREFAAMETDATWIDRCHVVMPDHLHALIVLGDRLPLARAVQRLKAKTAGALLSSGLTWERGFFDHKLRANEPADAVFRYIYLNPYRGVLLGKQERWPHWHCAPTDWAWFSGQLEHELPIPEWLAR
jgi:REP element-mobilizing transposase RayT